MERRSVGGRGKRIAGAAAVAAYIAAIALANVLVTKYGYAALPFTAFAIIPFDMTARNVLHELWREKWLVPKMAALIFCGASVSFVLGGASLPVCVASFAAFATAGAVDSVVYQLLFDRTPLVKMNASNGAAAITDSIVFPLVAFGSLALPIMVAQAGMKFLGGCLWSLAARHLVARAAA
jgi:hypothetical protein